MRNKSINVGVIGTGGMGGRHVHNLTHEVAAAQVVALMDVDQARLQTVAAACGATHTLCPTSRKRYWLETGMRSGGSKSRVVLYVASHPTSCPYDLNHDHNQLT